MARAADARDWAPRALRGMIDSLYTPFSGPGGEQIDEHAFRALVTHCIGALDHDGIWVGGLVGEYWALTTQERKRLLEIAVDEIRTLKPDALIEACPASTNVLETVELARHAAATGADICFLIPPYFEARGYDSIARGAHLRHRTHRHRARAVQHPRRRLDPHARRMRPPRRRVPRNLRGQERHVPTKPLRGAPPARSRAGHLGVRHARLPRRLPPPRHRRARESSAARRTSTSYPTTGSTARNGTSSHPTSSPRRSTTGTTRDSTTSSPACTEPSGHPTSSRPTHTGDRRSRPPPPSSACPWATTRARALHSRHSPTS